jgi:hypothetical protein
MAAQRVHRVKASDLKEMLMIYSVNSVNSVVNNGFEKGLANSAFLQS